MHTKLIRIGNSQGVRLSKAIVEQANLGEDLELEVRGEEIVIRPARELRADWTDAARQCHERAEDGLDEWDGVAGDEWS